MNTCSAYGLAYGLAVLRLQNTGFTYFMESVDKVLSQRARAAVAIALLRSYLKQVK